MKISSFLLMFLCSFTAQNVDARTTKISQRQLIVVIFHDTELCQLEQVQSSADEYFIANFCVFSRLC